MTAKVIHWLITIILLLALLFSLHQCNDHRKKATQSDKNFINQIKGFEVQISKAGDSIYRMDQIIIGKNSKIAKLIQENDAIRKIYAQVNIQEEYNLKNIPIPFQSLVLKQCDTSKANYMKLPAIYQDTANKWYRIFGGIDAKGAHRIDLLKIYSEPVITFGYAKKPFYKRLFKADEPIVTYTNKNPYMQVTDMSNIVIEGKKKSRFGVSIQVGYGLSLPTFTPGVYIGIGGDYRIISF